MCIREESCGSEKELMMCERYAISIRENSRNIRLTVRWPGQKWQWLLKVKKQRSSWSNSPNQWLEGKQVISWHSGQLEQFSSCKSQSVCMWNKSPIPLLHSPWKLPFYFLSLYLPNLIISYNWNHSICLLWLIYFT